MRAKYQVLVIPYRKTGSEFSYCIFKRSDLHCWQFIAGGGEEEDGSILNSAKREAWEEARISPDARYTGLDTRCSISTEHFRARAIWGNQCLVIPEYTFAVEVAEDIQISHEHTRYQWVNYTTAIEKLQYDSNKVGLWELDNKLKMELLNYEPL